MSKSAKRDAWNYAITALLIINLFVVNNYITQKAVKIIEAKNNTSMSTSNNIVSLKDGVVNSYTGMVDSVKNIVGWSTITSLEDNQTIISDSNATNPGIEPLNKAKLKKLRKPVVLAKPIATKKQEGNITKAIVPITKGGTL